MHYNLQQEDGTTQYRLESKAFSSIAKLLSKHVETSEPVTKASGAILRSPVVKSNKSDLPHSDIQVNRHIGKGEFGEVCEAILCTTGERVAIKTYRLSDLADMDSFVEEANILKQYKHPNIVRFIGVYAEKDPVYIVMELMPGGPLLEFLSKKGSQQGQRKLCSMAIDACKGMEYLEQQKCVHR